MKQSVTMFLFIMLAILSLTAFIYSVLTILGETFRASMNYAVPDFHPAAVIAFFASLLLAFCSIYLLVSFLHKERQAKKAAR